MADRRTAAARKAADTKGPEEHHRAALMAQWTMRFGKDDSINPYSLENYYPYLSRLGSAVPPYYIVTWDNKTGEDRAWAQEALREYQSQGFLRCRWSVGNTKRVAPGDRLLLLVQSNTPRGVVGIGRATSEPYPAPHWLANRAARGDQATYVDATWDYFHPEPIIREGSLPPELDDLVPWKSRRGGITLKQIGPHIEQELWRRTGRDEAERNPDEVDGTTFEGARKSVLVNAYERNGEARRACLAAYGYACAACGSSLADIYGPDAEGLIHVHHLVPLADIGRSYRVDGRKDLRPVCPNCHAVIHRRSSPYRIDEVRTMLARQRAAQANQP